MVLTGSEVLAGEYIKARNLSSVKWDIVKTLGQVRSGVLVWIVMTPNQLSKLYGSQSKIGRALNISRQTVHNWFKKNHVPRVWQLEIEKLTGGALKAEKRK